MNEGVKFLLELNEAHSKDFIDPGHALKRRQYRRQHPTQIVALKCMDGRLHLPVMTNTPLGIIQPFRNIAGRFDLGWMPFALSMSEVVQYAVSKGQNLLVLITYHFSKGDQHRGCRGFDYDSEAARAVCERLKAQFDRVYGRSVVYTVLIGIETDEEALLLHGDNGEVLDLATVKTSRTLDFLKMVRKLYPSMSDRVVADLMPLVVGNIEHISTIRAINRPPLDMGHREWVLAVGRGFDWMHVPNTALIVGPYDPDLPSAIATAAQIIATNFEQGSANKDACVLMTSAPYREVSGPERLLAAEKSRFLNRHAMEIIRSRVPNMPPIQEIVTTVDMNTRRADVLVM